jgi:ech hydrogenase subunit E
MHDLVFPIGPQHPGLKEPVFFKVYLKGDIITDLKFGGGYVHRGMEKLMEGQEVLKAAHSAEKICGICSYSHSACITQAAESILKINTSVSVKMTRMVIAELERIHSHLLWMGFLFHDIGYETLFMYFWRERSKIIDLFEELTGQRIHHGINFIGTTKINIPKNNNIMHILNELNDKIKDYKNEIITDEVIRSRFVNKGIISKKLAKKYSIVGPTARASGINFDVRSLGYEGYDLIKFNPIVRTKGDVMERLTIRIDEMIESINIIKQALDLIKEPVEKNKQTYIKRGEGYYRIEAPRGELFYYLSVKKNEVLRVKVKTPTFNNFPILKPLIIGSELGDLPIIVASIDPCIGCMERVMVVKNNKDKILTKNEFMEMCGYEHKHKH